jgi:hypothetical protein
MPGSNQLEVWEKEYQLSGSELAYQQEDFPAFDVC